MFLKAAERQFSQNLSTQSVKDVSAIMVGLPFTSAAKDLPRILLTTLRVMGPNEQKALSNDILNLVNDQNTTIEAKNIALGIILEQYTGIELLIVTVKELKNIYENTIVPQAKQIDKTLTKLQTQLTTT